LFIPLRHLALVTRWIFYNKTAQNTTSEQHRIPGSRRFGAWAIANLLSIVSYRNPSLAAELIKMAPW